LWFSQHIVRGIFISDSSSPVAAILMSKLIRDGYLLPSIQKCGMLAMAGISHGIYKISLIIGPYPHLKSSVLIKYVESDPARQLFDFNSPDSSVAKLYYEAMEHILDSGARYAAIGSWYDQVCLPYLYTSISIA
jgi:hypothetical protein